MTITPVKPSDPQAASTIRREPSWFSPEGEAPEIRFGMTGWLLVALRLPPLVMLLFGGLAVHLSLRLIERPLFGLRRPVTPYVTQGVCKVALLVLGVRLERRGTPMRGRGAVVSNHASWLDIFAVNALQRVYFVSKSEVAGWAGIGWLARATGTVFINRDARDARRQKEIFEARLRAGHHLCFFPEGTSTDGARVISFKPTLFAAFFSHGLAEILQIQPVTLAYLAPAERDPRFYAWWGELGFAPHLLRILATVRRGRVVVMFHPTVRVADFPGRKELARHCETAVRAGLRDELPPEVLRE